MTLSVTTKSQEATTWVVVTGELDIATAPELGDVLDEVVAGDAEHVIVDLSGLGFMDSSGLSCILGAHQRLAEKGRSLTLEGPSQYIIKMLDVTGLARVFEVRVNPTTPS